MERTNGVNCFRYSGPLHGGLAATLGPVNSLQHGHGNDVELAKLDTLEPALRLKACSWPHPLVAVGKAVDLPARTSLVEIEENLPQQPASDRPSPPMTNLGSPCDLLDDDILYWRSVADQREQELEWLKSKVISWIHQMDEMHVSPAKCNPLIEKQHNARGEPKDGYFRYKTMDNRSSSVAYDLLDAHGGPLRELFLNAKTVRDPIDDSVLIPCPSTAWMQILEFCASGSMPNSPAPSLLEYAHQFGLTTLVQGLRSRKQPYKIHFHDDRTFRATLYASIPNAESPVKYFNLSEDWHGRRVAIGYDSFGVHYLLDAGRDYFWKDLSLKVQCSIQRVEGNLTHVFTNVFRNQESKNSSWKHITNGCHTLFNTHGELFDGRYRIEVEMTYLESPEARCGL